MIANAAASPQQPHQEEDPAQILAKQFNMTDAEAEMILCIVRKNDPDLELLKLPKVQEIITHRKGRWIQEEEDFSLFLCEEFSLGLSKLDNGVTKRAYLSNKLHCPKMRISKKFRGKNPGKDVFVQKEYQKGKQKDGRKFTPEELCYYEQRHEELEKRFLKAVLKTTLKSGIRQKKGSKMSALSLGASSGSAQQPASIDANLPAKQSPTIAMNLPVTASCTLQAGQSTTIAMKSSTTAMMKLPATPFEGSSDGASPVNNMGCNEFPATNIAIPSCPRPVEQTKTNAMQYISMPFISTGNAMLPTNNIGFTQNPATQIPVPQNVPGSAPLIQDPHFVPFFGAPGTSNTGGQMLTTSSVVNIPTSVTTLPSSTSSPPPQTMIGQGPFEPNIMQLYSSFVQSMNSQQASPTSTLMSSTTVGLNRGPTIVGMQPPTIPLHDTHPSVLGIQSPIDYANTLMKMPMSENIQVKGQFGVDHSSITTTQGNASGCNQAQKYGQNTATSSNSAYGQNSASSSVSASGQSTTNSSVSANNSVHVGMKNNRNTLSNGPEYSRKRAGAEIVGLLGCDFATSLNAGGGKRFKSISNTAVSHAVSTSASEPSSNDESENVSSSNEASFSYGISKRKDMTSKNDNEIPDILSGFDQHVATMKSGATIPEDSHFFAGAGGPAESPYITSKSFDELHQFLGKGISVNKMPPPLDLNESVSNYNPVPHHTDARSLARPNLANRGAFIPVVPQMPIGINHQQYLSVCHQYGRPSSVSNSSELTFSD